MNIQKMLKQAQEMQQKMVDMQRNLEEQVVEGQAGAGMVKVSLTGKGGLLKIDISPELLAKDEKEVLEDLIVAAHRDAKEKIDAAAGDAMAGITGGLNLPPGFKMPF